MALVDGDMSWMLASAALCQLMTPGLAFFYGGSCSEAIENDNRLRQPATTIID